MERVHEITWNFQETRKNDNANELEMWLKC